MITRTQQIVLYGPSIFSPCNHESVHWTKAILQPRSRSVTWSLSLLCRLYSLQLAQTSSHPWKLIQVNPLGVSQVTLLQLNFICQRDPSVKSLRDASVSKFIHDRIMNCCMAAWKLPRGWETEWVVPLGWVCLSSKSKWKRHMMMTDRLHVSPVKLCEYLCCRNLTFPALD